MSEIGSPREDDFAASLERAGNKAFEFAESYFNKMSAMMSRELGSTKTDPQEELMEYARIRHDPQMLHDAYLQPLMQRMGKGRGREAFLKYVKQMEAKLFPQNGTGY